MKDVIIIGAGGHSKVLIAALKSAKVRIRGVVDADPAKVGATILGIRIIGDDSALEKFDPSEISLVNGIGSIADDNLRAKLFDRMTANGYQFTGVTHASAVVADDVDIGTGTQIMAGAIVQPGSEIGVNVIINSRASIDHDCRIGNHGHVAPGAILCGRVMLGNRVFIGAGACIRDGVSIGDDVFVGMGALVISDVVAGQRVMAIPNQPLSTQM